MLNEFDFTHVLDPMLLPQRLHLRVSFLPKQLVSINSVFNLGLVYALLRHNRLG